jgi:L-alanine-DL-glutamate epimerase-like enolase superfamily enzyme
MILPDRGLSAAPDTDVDCELWRLRIPLASAVGTPGRTFSSTQVLLAIVHDRFGHCGTGYSRFFDPADLDPAARAARMLLGGAGTLRDLLQIERTEQIGTDQSVASRSAANAISMAAWDLAGRQRGVACADLWGRPTGRDAIGCYASALYLNTPVCELADEARGYRARNYRQVKMRVAPTLEETMERLAAVQAVYPEPGTIAIEAALSWTPAVANAFLRSPSLSPLWVEDPVQYRLFAELERTGHRIAAGEVLGSARELAELYASGRVANVIIDVQAIGGPVRFLEAARMLHALGANVGSHRFPHQSAHLLAALPRSLGVETVDWSNPSLRPLSDPGASGEVRVLGPGFNTSLDRAIVEEHGERVM